MLIKKIMTASLLLMASSTLYAHADWTTRYGNAAKTSALSIMTNTDKYKIIWERSFVDDAAMHFYTSGPLIADHNIFYTVSSFEPYETTIVALDTASGKEKWRLSLKNHYISIYYQDGKLLSKEHRDVSEYMRALNANTGDLIYEHLMPDGTNRFLTTKNAAYFSTDENTLAGYDTKLGELAWMEKLSPGRHLGSSFAISNDYIVTQLFDGFLVFNRKNLKDSYKTWVEYTSDNNRDLSPIINTHTNTALAIFTDDTPEKSGNDKNQATLVALDLGKHTHKWKLPKQNNLIMPVLINNTIFSVQVDMSTLNAVSTETGRVRWTWKLPADDVINDSSMMVATEDVVFLATKNRVYAISQRSHQTVWQFNHHAYRLALGDNKLFMFRDQGETESRAFITALALT